MKKQYWFIFLLLTGLSAAAQRPGEHTLPVMFDSVRAAVEAGGVRIGWTNLTERDISLYLVERSTDGRTFSEINRQFPISNKNDKASYSYFDPNPAAGTVYYRIRVNESHGKIIFSRILKVQSGNLKQSFSIYPNPSTGNQFTIGLTGFAKGAYSMRVLNSMGQEVMNTPIYSAGNGLTQTFMLAPSSKSGVYACILTGDGIRETRMLILQ